MYQHGQGVQQNPREGAEWIKRAADQGSASAQYRLALMHQEGLGVPKDPDKAKELLLSTDLNISQVAYEVGFKDPKYFNRSFNQVFGYPPREVRKSK